jgi:hypothetical protein
MIREELENHRKVDLKGRNSDYTIYPKYMKINEGFENIFRKKSTYFKMINLIKYMILAK